MKILIYFGLIIVLLAFTLLLPFFVVVVMVTADEIRYEIKKRKSRTIKESKTGKTN